MRIICVPMLFSRKNSIWKDVSPKGAVTDSVSYTHLTLPTKA